MTHHNTEIRIGGGSNFEDVEILFSDLIRDEFGEARLEDREKLLNIFKPFHEMAEAGQYAFSAEYLTDEDGMFRESYEFYNSASRILEFSYTMVYGWVGAFPPKDQLITPAVVLEQFAEYEQRAQDRRDPKIVACIHRIVQKLLKSSLAKHHSCFTGEPGNTTQTFTLTLFAPQSESQYSVRLDAWLALPTVQEANYQGVIQ